MSSPPMELHDAIVGLWQKHLEILQLDRQDFVTLAQEMGFAVIEESNLKLPELRGSVFRLKDKSAPATGPKSHEKLQCLLESMFDRIQDIDNKQKYFQVQCLIPEFMVSYVIGAKGHQINQIKESSRAEVVLQEPNEKLNNLRAARVEGRGVQVSKAIRMIYEVIEIKRDQQEIDLHKRVESKCVDQVNSMIRMLFNNKQVGYMIGKKGEFVRYLQDQFAIKVKFIEDRYNKTVKRDESVCLVTGKLDQVMRAVIYLLKRSRDYHEDLKQDFQEVTVRLLIDSKYTSKLIGSQGCIIKEIAKKSQGAQIKIHSQKGQVDNIIQIRGSLPNKTDAVCLIIQKLEVIKHGRPLKARQSRSVSRSRSGVHRSRSRSSLSRSSRGISSRSRSRSRSKMSRSRSRFESSMSSRSLNRSPLDKVTSKTMPSSKFSYRERDWDRDRVRDVPLVPLPLPPSFPKQSFLLAVPNHLVKQLPLLKNSLTSIEVLSLKEKYEEYSIYSMKGLLQDNCELFRRILENKKNQQ